MVSCGQQSRVKASAELPSPEGLSVVVLLQVGMLHWLAQEGASEQQGSIGVCVCVCVYRWCNLRGRVPIMFIFVLGFWVLQVLTPLDTQQKINKY